MQDLFIELFPFQLSTIPDLSAYQIAFNNPNKGKARGEISYRLNHTFPGFWIDSGDIIITNEPVAPIQMEIAVDQWKAEAPELYRNLSAIEEIMDWTASPRHIADYIFWTQILPIEDELRAALAKMTVTITNGRIARDYRLRPWAVNHQPALSITIHSRMIYHQNLHQYTQALQTSSEIVGLAVIDTTSTVTGTIKSITGTIAERRDALLAIADREAIQNIIKNAPDDELTIEVTSGQYSYEYPASALNILIEPDNHDALQQFKINPQQAQRALNLNANMRSQLVKILSDHLKSRDIIDNAYNSRTAPELFLQAVFDPSIEFGDKRTRDFDFDSLPIHFQQNGIYKRHPRFDNAPIKIAIINTLDETIDDFVEALRRALERNYKFKIDMLRERKVRVISNKNLESAVRVAEKEEPQILLAFLPDTDRDNLDTYDPNFQQVKSLALGKGIASHAIYRKTVHDPESMSRVIMGILGKTGNLPYILAEPLDYADMVVGMDMVRQELTQFDRVTAMARIYDNYGRGFGYIMESVEIEKGDSVPFIVMQTLFPSERFSGKRVIIHRQNAFTSEELTMLARWEQVINTTFYPIAIETDVVPHLYSFEKKTIAEPEWGTIFQVDGLEAFITTATQGDNMPMPLHVTAPFDLGIDLALHSVLMWTLLHYGTSRPARLPVTIQYAKEMQEWISRGQLPSATAGDVPFWL